MDSDRFITYAESTFYRALDNNIEPLNEDQGVDPLIFECAKHALKAVMDDPATQSIVREDGGDAQVGKYMSDIRSKMLEVEAQSKWNDSYRFLKSVDEEIATTLETAVDNCEPIADAIEILAGDKVNPVFQDRAVRMFSDALRDKSFELLQGKQLTTSDVINVFMTLKTPRSGRDVKNYIEDCKSADLEQDLENDRDAPAIHALCRKYTMPFEVAKNVVDKERNRRDQLSKSGVDVTKKQRHKGQSAPSL